MTQFRVVKAARSSPTAQVEGRDFPPRVVDAGLDRLGPPLRCVKRLGKVDRLACDPITAELVDAHPEIPRAVVIAVAPPLAKFLDSLEPLEQRAAPLVEIGFGEGQPLSEAGTRRDRSDGGLA
jgi:hypothetical protein